MVNDRKRRRTDGGGDDGQPSAVCRQPSFGIHPSSFILHHSYLVLANIVLAALILTCVVLGPAPPFVVGAPQAAAARHDATRPFPPQGDTAEDTAPVETWEKLSVGDMPIGYIHSVTRKAARPRPIIITSIFSQTCLRRMALTITMQINSEFRESPDGSLLSAQSDTYSANTRTTCKAVVQGKHIRITASMGGPKRTWEIPLEAGVIGPQAQVRQLVAAGLKAGATVTSKMFAPEFYRVIRCTFTIEGQETLTIDGKPMKLWRGTMEQDALPGIVARVWLNDKGYLIRSVISMLGSEIETVQTTRQKALAALAAGSKVDLLTMSMVSSDKEIKRPSDVREALFRIEGTRKSIKALKLKDRRQTVEERKLKSILLRVRALGDAPKPAAEKPGKEYLSPSLALQSDDPEIIRVAQEAVGDAKTPFDKAKRLEEWVCHNVTRKDLSTGFASAKEVLVSRRGDCTEHAVLLAAMLRAVKIPSRCAAGLVYWKGEFGYHMWTEAFLNDWTALDATLNREVVDATHIRLVDSALQSGSLLDSFTPLVRVLGNISIKVIEVNY